MGDRDSAIVNPLPCGILFVLDMAVSFCGQIMAPFDTSFIVVVQWCGLLCIGDWVAEGIKMKNHITNIDPETRSHICSPNFRFTRAQGGTFLKIFLPNDGSTGAKDDGAAHAAKFKEWELDTVTYCTTDL